VGQRKEPAITKEHRKLLEWVVRSERLKALEIPFVSFERCRCTGWQVLKWSLPGKERDCAATASFSCHRKETNLKICIILYTRCLCEIILFVASMYFYLFIFSAALRPNAGHGLLILEVSRSHNDASQSVGRLWTSDQLVAETSTWQNTTLTTDKHPCPPVGFELTISAGERLQTNALDRALLGPADVRLIRNWIIHAWYSLIFCYVFWRLFISDRLAVPYMSDNRSGRLCVYVSALREHMSLAEIRRL